MGSNVKELNEKLFNPSKKKLITDFFSKRVSNVDRENFKKQKFEEEKKIFIMEIFYLKREGDLSTAFDLKPRLIKLELDSHLNFRIANFDLKPLIYFDIQKSISGIETVKLNSKNEFKSPEISYILKELGVDPPDESKFYIHTRIFRYEIYIPILYEIKENIIPEKLLSETAKQFDLKIDYKNNEKTLKELTKKIKNQFYPNETFIENYKQKKNILFIARLKENENYFSKNFLPLDLFKYIFRFFTNSYFDKIKYINWVDEMKTKLY